MYKSLYNFMFPKYVILLVKIIIGIIEVIEFSIFSFICTYMLLNE